MTIEELKKERAIIRGLAVLNDDNLANEVIETNNVQNVLMFTLELIDEKISQLSVTDEDVREAMAISKTETTSVRALSCWYCTGIESHSISTIKTVTDEFGRELPAYDTPYNYCPNCGRKLR